MCLWNELACMTALLNIFRTAWPSHVQTSRTWSPSTDIVCHCLNCWLLVGRRVTDWIHGLEFTNSNWNPDLNSNWIQNWIQNRILDFELELEFRLEYNQYDFGIRLDSPTGVTDCICKLVMVLYTDMLLAEPALLNDLQFTATELWRTVYNWALLYKVNVFLHL